MDMPESMKVSEASRIYKEERELLDVYENESPEEQESLLEEIETDSRYDDAREIHDELQNAASVFGKVLRRVEGNVSTLDDSTVSAAPERDYESLFDSIEDTETQAEYYEGRQRDIQLVHDVLENHAGRLAKMEKVPTRKQKEAAERALKQELQSVRGTDLMAEPHRLAVMLESIIAKDDVSEQARREVKELISERVGKCIEANARDTDPDDIANWLRMANRPSIAQQDVRKTLIGSYFKPLLGVTSEQTIVHYENFIRGILRVADEPTAARYGLDIIEFKDKSIIPNNAMYNVYLQSFGGAGFHRPDLMARLLTAGRAITDIKLGINEDVMLELTDAMTEGAAKEFKRKSLDPHNPDNAGVVEQTASFVQRFQRGSLKGNESAIFAIQREAVGEIGIEEYKARHYAMQSIQEAVHDLPVDMAEYTDFLFDSEFGEGRMNDYLIHYAVAKSPSQEAFIRAVLSSDSLVRSDSDVYLTDRTLEATLRMNEHLAETNSKLFGNAPLIDMARDYLKLKREVDMGDGYIIGIFGQNEEELTDEEGRLKQVNPDVLEAAKKRFAERSGGMYSRNHLFYDDESGFSGMMRHKTEEDSHGLHDLETVLGDARMQRLFSSEHDPREIIDGLRDDILKNRRRFMNIRGIAAELTGTDNEQAAIRLELRKHPKNPQAFIGTVKLNGVKPVRFLIDPDMNILTGKKRVVNKERLQHLNAAALTVLQTFMCQQVVETEEGIIGDGKSAITERIAHLRLLPEGSKHTYEAWSTCLGAEGLDLEVLSAMNQKEKETTRVSTYVKAIENDSEAKPPLKIYLTSDAELARI